MKLYGKTDIGMVRESNQDADKIEALGVGAGFALVCDGMGGANGGDYASAIARKSITGAIKSQYTDTMTDEEIKKLALDAVYKANLDIYSASCEDQRLEGMGTTAVLVILCHGKAICTYVGDSRLYQYKGGKLRLLTKDHSRVQYLVDNGIITREEAKSHPEKNMLTRAVGVSLQIKVDSFEFPFSKGEKLLLCSDGLTNSLADEDIEQLLCTYEGEELVNKLVSNANIVGGSDNITVVLIEG